MKGLDIFLQTALGRPVTVTLSTDPDGVEVVHVNGARIFKNWLGSPACAVAESIIRSGLVPTYQKAAYWLPSVGDIITANQYSDKIADGVWVKNSFYTDVLDGDGSVVRSYVMAQIADDLYQVVREWYR